MTRREYYLIHKAKRYMKTSTHFTQGLEILNRLLSAHNKSRTKPTGGSANE